MPRRLRVHYGPGHFEALTVSRDPSGSRRFTWARLEVACIIRVRVGSLRSALGLPDSFGFAWVQSGALSGCRNFSGSRRFTRRRIGVAWFVQVCVGSLGRA